ncbi:hypothetical protein JQ628_11225 [Bradyrhizobium lablabi]|uniref:hypothetical protein n=1 Tax=Bradyrhizobium lablabi TaxID=722472 RepID=UPI001BABD49C|nr:hypothetical protein [Bradyrhizobium lablabi]MBR1122087.1 hypothetical protein [Bradyrhizobium lablabi]
MQFEPGWLMKTCRAAHISSMMQNSPSLIRSVGLNADTPVPDDEAEELFALMNSRFRAWTGRSLAEQMQRST